MARAFIRMAEEHIYFHQVQDRWGDEANWAVTRQEYFGFIPAPVLSGYAARCAAAMC